MPTFRQADPDAVAILEDLMETVHKRLDTHGVTVGCLFAHAKIDEKTGMRKGPALKLHGYPALAIVKINSYRDRVEGKPDATVCVDGDDWGSWPVEKQRALLDHELTHLELVFDDEGGVKLDDACRPRLVMRPHDIVIGGFEEVIDRHQQHSCEAESYMPIHKMFTQKLFPWG